MHAEITQELEEYCEAHSTPESDLLYRINRETHVKVMNPRMLSGHLQGMFLAAIVRMMRAQTVLEIGTYTGYSAICMAEALPENGRLDTIEINVELEDMIRRNFAQSPAAAKLQLHIGDALQVIPSLPSPWDLVFMDADKEDYIAYYELVLPLVRPGGFILADNVLWSGKVLEAAAPADKDTQALCQFNKYILEDQRVKNLLLPFRDGMMIIEKL
ncbi:MAG: O-methyltransferase [Bacteroidales bacterium]|nr:O-methyltransferase [Bacteroidales bacterium]